MSEVHPSTTPAAAEPITASAQEATTDPIRTNPTKDLAPESRPEVTEGSSALPAETTTTTGAVEDVPKDVAAVESQPINEGVLGYKQPGLVKSLIYSKKFFWFNDEPLEHKHLTDYLRSEKAIEIARPNAAHATQTGKGLLFFAKRAEDKPQPQGIINLADIKELTKTGPAEFTFKYHSHKHAFQAGNATERDGWYVALETRHAEAKTDHDAVVGSEGYKSSLDTFSKPSAIAGASTSRSLSRHKKAQDTETPKAPVTAGVTGDSASSSDEAKTSNAKSRSQSRKRGSMFGALLGKKEQHDEKKELKKEEKEEKKEEKAEEKAVKADVKEDKVEKQAEKEERNEDKSVVKEEKKAPKSDGVVEPKPLDAAAVASRVLADPVIPVEGAKTEESPAAATLIAEPSSTTEPSASTAPRETAPKVNKRNSIFGFFGKKETQATNSPTDTATTANEAAPVVPAKDTEPASTSPVAAQPATSATESSSPVSPDTTKANRRSSFFSNLGTKKEKRTGGVSDAEGTDGEGRKSGGFGGLLRKASLAQGHRSTSKPAATTNGAADTDGRSGEVVHDSTTGTSQQTPVQAAA